MRGSRVSMSTHDYKSAERPAPDKVLTDIADYALSYRVDSNSAYETAYYCLMDTLACGFQALQYPACTKLMGPIVPGATMPGGARVPGTSYELDPVQAAFNIGAMIRWLDFNDTWLAAEWGHPSDNLGGILAVADYLSRTSAAQGINAVSNAWIDGGALRTYRHAPNTGSRKSWAAGDATSRAVRHALIALTGEMGYPTALSAPRWGFYDVLFKGQRLALSKTFGSYVMEHVLFKVPFPAEFHAQTAVECAIALHPQVKDRLQQIDRIVIETQEPAIRIIDKTGPLNNPADRDHCIQYMVAVPLIHGTLTADHYEDEAARDPRIDALRQRMQVVELPRYSADYLDPDKRSIANAVQVFFEDGTSTERVEVEYPIGHRRRREESIPLLWDKFRSALATRFDAKRVARIVKAFEDPI